MQGAREAAPADLAYRSASPDDAESISAMAREIWEEIYPAIISREQIKYMLEWMYNPETLRREMAEKGIVYTFIDRGSQPVGYLAFSDEGSHTFLHKIYLKPEVHSCGIGSAAIKWLLQKCADSGSPSIRLRVNKANAAAIKAYERNGFTRIDAICDDIGNGYVMDDFVYQKEI